VFDDQLLLELVTTKACVDHLHSIVISVENQYCSPVDAWNLHGVRLGERLSDRVLPTLLTTNIPNLV